MKKERMFRAACSEESEAGYIYFSPAEIRGDYADITIGYYETPEEAHQACMEYAKTSLADYDKDDYINRPWKI